MPSAPSAAGVKTSWGGPVPRQRNCPPIGKASVGHSVNAPPVRATPPPWATHGQEVDRNVSRKHANPHLVHFRGTESLASMHMIDQEQAANARLSQKLTASIFADPGRHLPTVSEDHSPPAHGGHKMVQRSTSWSRHTDGKQRPSTGTGTLHARASRVPSSQMVPRSTTAPPRRSPSHGPRMAPRPEMGRRLSA
eukprot:s1546_g2.t1